MSVSRNIVLGVTGSIAAYKAVDLASLLTKQKCQVRAVLTPDAQRFITPLPFKVLTRQPVVTDLYDEEEGWKPAHIRLADEADVHRTGIESEGENFDRSGDERKNVVASGHAGKCRHPQGARRGIHRAGRRDALLWL
jgi:Flavoprotein